MAEVIQVSYRGRFGRGVYVTRRDHEEAAAAHVQDMLKHLAEGDTITVEIRQGEPL